MSNIITREDKDCHQILERSYHYDDLIFKNVIEELKKAPKIKIIPKPNSKMGFLSFKDKEIFTFTQVKGVYTVILDCKNNEANIYNGQSNSDNGGINNRIARCVKQAQGEQRNDERHSGGQYLYDRFGPSKYWPDNLYVRFITLNRIKELCKDISFQKYSNPFFVELLGEEDSNEIITIDDMTDASVLDFFEKLSFDIMEPVANKNNTNQGKYNKIFLTHLKSINEVPRVDYV